MSKRNMRTGMSSTAFSMPCFLRRWVTFWKGWRVPVSGSYATHSPSTIASLPFSCLRRASPMSGKLEVRSSRRLENSFTNPPGPFFMWACTLMPSYLYSNAHLPPNLSIISGRERRRSASITFTGFPTETSIPFTASRPPDARVSATNPISHVMLNALSISGRSSLEANAEASASIAVMVPAPTLILPVTILQRYLASRGDESWSIRASSFIFLSWESLPDAFSMAVRPSMTFWNDRGSENRVICFFLAMSISATSPGSPVFVHRSSTSSDLLPDTDAIAFSTSLSAMPSSRGTKSGWSLPTERYMVFLISSGFTFLKNSASMSVISRRLLVFSNLSNTSARSPNCIIPSPEDQ